MNSETDPKHISISKSKGIQIDWKDGLHSEFDIRYLRDMCPCASCTGAHGTPSLEEQQNEAGKSPFQMYTRTLRIDHVEPVGAYAIKIRWSDGHDTGIYTWDYLRKISRP
jgi:DUF971 family protein